MPSATALTTFLCYTVIAREPLTVSKAFTSIALLNHLQSSMVALPGQVFAMLHGTYVDIYSYAVVKSHVAYVSMQRIEDFLREEEVDDWACSLSAPIKNRHNGNVEEYPLTAGFSNAVFRWPGMPTTTDTTPSSFLLGPLNVTFPPGGLSIVSGPTGSGKSAFLAALLGGLFFRHSLVPFSDVERDQK